VSSVDFANILFSGPCNRACPFCIGREMPDHVNGDSLDVFPPRNLEAFIEEVRRLRIRQVVFTGTTSDPQLYRHEASLLHLLRSRLPADVSYSVHTNGALALRKIDVFNLYDKACLSIPSLEPGTYEKMTGSRQVPDLRAILNASRIPVKISCVVTDDNEPEIGSFLARCRSLGVRRVVLRRIYGDRRPWRLFTETPARRTWRGNPVYDVDGLEVTLWSFEEAESRSINLFSDGTLGRSYLLAQTRW